jgi:hypothetical protein
VSPRAPLPTKSTLPSGKPVTAANPRQPVPARPRRQPELEAPWAKELPLDMAESSGNKDLVAWLRGKGAKSAEELKSEES